MVHAARACRWASTRLHSVSERSRGASPTSTTTVGLAHFSSSGRAVITAWPVPSCSFCSMKTRPGRSKTLRTSSRSCPIIM